MANSRQQRPFLATSFRGGYEADLKSAMAMIEKIDDPFIAAVPAFQGGPICFQLTAFPMRQYLVLLHT
jgi:hypothetical protein